MPDDVLVLEDATILYRNFSGTAGPYNREGERSFSVIIDDAATAERLANDGWNIKVRDPREEGDDPILYLDISVNYKYRPPTIFMITSKGRQLLVEDLVGTLDWADITNVDLSVRPYAWDVNGKQGIKAYLASLYVKVEEDYLAAKYSDV